LAAFFSKQIIYSVEFDFALDCSLTKESKARKLFLHKWRIIWKQYQILLLGHYLKPLGLIRVGFSICYFMALQEVVKQAQHVSLYKAGFLEIVFHQVLPYS
jgi:hypothetical protein